MTNPKNPAHGPEPMPDTDALIDSLVGKLTPVKRLKPPVIRAAGLIVLATIVIALFTMHRGFRQDIHDRMAEPSYLIAVAAAWMTGVTATLAAFEVSLPDRSRFWMLVPAPAVILWVWGVGYGCLAHWIAIPEGAPVQTDSMHCMQTLIGSSIPLGLVLWRMLRRSKPLRKMPTVWLGALAIAAFADTAHLLLHMVNATVLVLVMNFGVTGIILLVFAALSGRSLGFLNTSS